MMGDPTYDTNGVSVKGLLLNSGRNELTELFDSDGSSSCESNDFVNANFSPP